MPCYLLPLDSLLRSPLLLCQHVSSTAGGGAHRAARVAARLSVFQRRARQPPPRGQGFWRRRTDPVGRSRRQELPGGDSVRGAVAGGMRVLLVGHRGRGGGEGAAVRPPLPPALPGPVARPPATHVSPLPGRLAGGGGGGG